jgi:predicted peroxiredoxin
MAEDKKLVLMCTHGPEDPERATIPFALASAAIASGVVVVIGVQANGGLLLKKGIAEHVFAGGFPPLKQLIDLYVQAGGRLLLCAPCMQARKIAKEDLIEGVEIVSGATFVKEFIEATNVAVY